jgi:hypothetical protein
MAGKYGPETGIDENGLPFFRIGEYKMNLCNMKILFLWKITYASKRWITWD